MAYYNEEPRWSYRPNEGLFGESMLSEDERMRRAHEQKQMNYTNEAINEQYVAENAKIINLINEANRIIASGGDCNAVKKQIEAALANPLFGKTSREDYDKLTKALNSSLNQINNYDANRQNIGVQNVGSTNEVTQTVEQPVTDEERQHFFDIDLAKKMEPMIKQMNYDFEKAYEFVDTEAVSGYTNKVIREYERFEELLRQIKDENIKMDLEKQVSFNFDQIDQLCNKVSMNLKRHREADLVRAKEQAKTRYQNLSTLEKVKQKIVMRKATTGAEFDALYRNPADIMYNDMQVEGRSR